MTAIEGIIGALAAGVVSIFFWLFKRGHTRIDDVDKRLREAITEKEARELIADKIEPLRAQNLDLARRLGRLEVKIDRLIELSVNTTSK